MKVFIQIIGLLFIFFALLTGINAINDGSSATLTVFLLMIGSTLIRYGRKI